MPGRSYNSNSYRYGYNKGSEKDDEIAGNGNLITTEFRELDTRLGRWWSIDPKHYFSPWQSPYVAMDNNPIWFNDALGDVASGDDKPYKGGIQMYEAADAKGEVPGGQSNASKSFKVGDYDVLPNYITNDKGEQEFSHYTASIMVNEITAKGKEQTARIDYVFGEKDLQKFKDNVTTLSAAAMLIYGADTRLSQWKIDMLNGNGGQLGMLKEQWSNPVNWIAGASAYVAWARSFSYSNVVTKGGNTISEATGYGQKFSFNTSHGYSRPHANGKSFTGLKVTSADIESGIALDAYRNANKIPTVTNGQISGGSAYQGSVNVRGVDVGYRAVNNGGTINVTTYWPQ